MSFWKLVGAIVVGNLLTGIAALLLWIMLLAGLLSGSFSNPSVPSANRDTSYGVKPEPVITDPQALQPVTNALPYDAFDNISASIE